MITKQAEQRIAELIDIGFIEKCAEYGLDIKNSEDQKTIKQLMDISYQEMMSGKIKVK